MHYIQVYLVPTVWKLSNITKHVPYLTMSCSKFEGSGIWRYAENMKHRFIFKIEETEAATGGVL